jgi:DHA1 family tetracycline resistance protein-like MFS transporter
MDISDGGSKAGNLALLNGALGASWVVGPPLGGLLADPSVLPFAGASTPFWLEAAFLALVIGLVYVTFRETLPRRATGRLDVLSQFRCVRDAMGRAKLRAVFGIWATFVGGWWLFESFLPSYLQEVLGYTPSRVGLFLGFMGATFLVTSVCVVKPVAARVRPETMVRVFLPAAAASVAALAFVTSAWALHVAILAFVATMGFTLPGLVGTVSNLADADTQGQALGITASLQALTTVLAMAFGGALFACGERLPILGGAALLAAAWVWFGLVFRTGEVAKEASA